MSIRVDTILQPLSVQERLHGDSLATGAEAFKTQRIFKNTMEQLKQVRPLITQIIDTTGELKQELAELKVWKGNLDFLSAMTAGLFAGAAKCCFSAECASKAGIEETHRVPRAGLLTAVGIVSAVSFQLIKITFFSGDQSLHRSQLTRLWTELQTDVPADFIRAGHELNVQMLEASENLRDIEERLAYLGGD